MPEAILDGNGSGFLLTVNPDGSINTNAGNPGSASYNPEVVIQYIGSEIGSVYKNTSAGSMVKVLTYDAGSNIINISPWTGV